MKEHNSLVESINLSGISSSFSKEIIRISLWNNGFSGEFFVNFDCGESELSRIQPPPGYESTLWGVYLIAMHLADQAQLNLGYSVAVEGSHLIDDAIRTLLSCQKSIRIVSSGRENGLSVDTFIGCSLPALARVLPTMSRYGMIFLPCSNFSDAQNLNIYSTIHRNGLRVYAAKLGYNMIHQLPKLNQRLQRLMTRCGHLSIVFQKQRSNPETRWHLE